MALNDPYARLFSIMGGYTPPEYSKIPTSGTSPYDFGLDPLNPYPTEQAISGEAESADSDADEAEKEREDRSGGDHGDYVGSDRDYAYEPEYWGGYKDGAWAPDYGLGTSLKSLGYGKALGQALRKGGLLGSLLGLSGNKFNPLNDPAHIEGIKQAGTQFNFDPAMMETAIQSLYDGVSATNPTGTKTTGLLNGLLGGLFNEASPSKINATDTLKGMVGMAGPWADLIDWDQTNFTHFDPTSPNRLALGDVDAYRAAQMMDAYNSGFGVAPSQYGIGMYQNLAMDPTLKPGWMNQYNDALRSGVPVGISGKIAAGIGLDSSEAGLAAGGGMGLNGKTGSSVGSFRDALDGWANGSLSTKEMEKAFGGYKEAKSGLMSGKKGNDKSGPDKGENGSEGNSSEHGQREGGGDRGCFPAGTLISMSNGKLVPIEKVTVGDKVKTWNGSVINDNEVKKTSKHIMNKMCEVSFESGKTLKCTPNHPIVTPSGLASVDPSMTEKMDHRKVAPLAKGSEVVTLEGTDIVDGISARDGVFEVFNLDNVSDDSTFYADGFCVHNKHSEY